MENTRFIQYYIELQNRFEDYFRRVLEASDIEDVHHLRVSIKILRTVWSLLDSASNGEWSKEDSSVAIVPVFREAGKLREIQINLKLIEKQPVNFLEPYAAFLIEKKEQAYSNLLSILQNYDVETVNEQKRVLPAGLVDVLDDEVLRIACYYAVKQVRKVKKLRRFLPGNFYLHQIRIRLIALRESIRIIHLITDDPEIEALLENLKAFTLRLGKWHDYTVLLRSIRTFSRTLEKQERKKMKKFRKQIQAKQRKRRLELRREIFGISMWEIQHELDKFF